MWQNIVLYYILSTRQSSILDCLWCALVSILHTHPIYITWKRNVIHKTRNT